MEKGQVIACKKNLVVIRMTRTEACAQCRACIAGMSKKDMVLEAENECGAQVGDWVEMELRNNGFFHAVMIMYGIPLVALLAGIVIGYFALAPLLPAVDSGIIGFGTGVALTALTYLWIHSQEKRWESKKFRPIAVKITSEPETICG